MRVYLAGPDVFLPDPLARAAALKAVCARHGLTRRFAARPAGSRAGGLGATGRGRVASRCATRRISVRADALIANLTPFRGPSADVGTVFELGFMRALSWPVFGWSNDARRFSPRTRAFLGAAARPAGGRVWRDGEGMRWRISARPTI